jgi:predicted XRE-type DNA-binding protein
MAIHKSSGNVFEDLEFDATEAQNLRIRSFLMNKISFWITENKFTQKEASKKLRVTQSRISDIKTGKIHKFTVDNLMYLLGATGVSFQPKETKNRTTLEVIIPDRWDSHPC